MIEHQERATENSRNYASKAWWELKSNQWDALTNVVSLHISDVLTCTQTYQLFPVGSRPGANSDPDTRGSKVKKFVFPGLLPIIYSWNKEDEMERLREGERQRGIPQREAFDVENKISFLICPLIEYTWHILSSYTLSASSSPFCLITLRVFTCLCLHVLCTHTWCLWFPHVCVRSEENEITCSRFNLQGGNGQRKY